MARAGLDTAAVVKAAGELADVDGLAQLTLARLAETLGVRTPSLYAHVGGLDDLRRRLAARGARELTAAVQAGAAGRARSDALRALAETYRAYAHAHPGTYAAMQRASDADDAPEVVAAGRELVEVMVAILSGYGLEGEEAIHGVRLVRASLHGFVSLEQEGGFRMPVALDDTYDRLIRMLDHGLLLAGSAG